MEIISRKEAKERGLKAYFSGNLCRRGHVSKRDTATGFCLACKGLGAVGVDEVKYTKSVYGKGFNSALVGEGYPTRIKGKITKCYDHWRRLLQRSYDPKWKRLHPTYSECSVEECWWDYQNFAEWFNSYEYPTEGMDLDKDLLIVNNKVYGPDTCVFLPEHINKLLTIRDSFGRGTFKKGGFEFYSGKKYLGRDKNEYNVEFSRIIAKDRECRIKEVSETYKEVLSPKAYESLMLFKLSVVDGGKIVRVR